MARAMLSMINSDHQTFLDWDTPQRTASERVTCFFQHTLSSQFWERQPLDERRACRSELPWGPYPRRATGALWSGVAGSAGRFHSCRGPAYVGG